MPNYNFELDLTTDNSNSIILRDIKPNSIVLELGSAHGRMTKYLRERLHCEVYVVEKDEEAGKVAAQYAIDSYLGKEEGDLEQTWWSNDLNGMKFDYIIIADVLEHLNTPEDVLSRAKFLLKDTGSIFISVPNIAHNAVLIELLHDEFRYRDVGILDKTHLKFFTYNSLKRFISELGLYTSKETNALNAVSNTEFGNSYELLPQEIAEYLQARPMGEVYQFVWELKRSQMELSIVIPVFGKWNFTKACLNDLMKLDPSKIEIIIIDNASPDDTSLNLADYEIRMPNLKCIRNKTNVFHSEACNQGYRASTSDKVLFLNNDIRVRSDFATWTATVIDACKNDVIVGPTMGLLDANFNFVRESNSQLDGNSYMGGWCIAANKATWQKIDIGNGEIWNTKYPMYFNDGDVSMRAKKAGIKLGVIKLPQVVHFGKISSSQINISKLYMEGRKQFLADYFKSNTKQN